MTDASNEPEAVASSPDKPADVVTRRSRRSPLAVSLATIAAVAVLGVVVFAIFGLGIRSVRQPAAVALISTQSPSPTPSESPSPTSTAAGDTLPAATSAPKPAQLFDGDCTEFYTDAEISRLTGQEMQLFTGGSGVVSQYGGQLLFALEETGGISCSWGVVQADGGFGPASTQVNFFAVPADRVAAPAKEETCGPPYIEGMYGDGLCAIEHVTGGIRFSGGVLAQTDAGGKSLSAKVIGRMDERAAASDFAGTAPVAGVWENPVDCAALGDALDVEATFGPGATFNDESAGHGSFGPPVGRDITVDYESLTCSGFESDGERIIASYRFGIMGGGAWVRDELGKSTPIDIPGIGNAYKWGDLLYVFTGPNLITLNYVEGDESGDYTDAAAKLSAVVAALNTL